MSRRRVDDADSDNVIQIQGLPDAHDIAHVYVNPRRNSRKQSKRQSRRSKVTDRSSSEPVIIESRSRYGRRHASRERKQPESQERGPQDADDVLNTFYESPMLHMAPPDDLSPAGEEYAGIPYEPRIYSSSYARPERKYNSRPEVRPTRVHIERERMHQYLLDRPDGYTGGRHDLWNRAVESTGDTEKERLIAPITLIVTRHGRRYRSRAFDYPKDRWNDAIFAKELKAHYASLKTRQIGLLQKVIAYKTIAFVYRLQYRCIDDRYRGRWQITVRLPITQSDDKEARDTFMNLLRYPDTSRKVWCRAIDELVVRT